MNARSIGRDEVFVGNVLIGSASVGACVERVQIEEKLDKIKSKLRDQFFGQRHVTITGKWTVHESELPEPIRRALKGRTRWSKATKTARRRARFAARFNAGLRSSRMKRRIGVHVPPRWLRRATMAKLTRQDRDVDRHDVYSMIARGMDYNSSDPRFEVYERGLYEHVGRGRRTERARRYLAGVGEFNEEIPF